MRTINDYSPVVGKQKIAELKKLARPLQDKHIVNVSSAFAGGGVAEMLNSFIILMNDLGVDTGWRLLIGDQIFFDVTKKFHNALQGEEIHLTERKKEIYLENNHRNAFISHFADHDCVIIHDPQPLAMIEFHPKREPWIWRCHIDLTHPVDDVYKFLSPYMRSYDWTIVSNQDFIKEDFQNPKVIYPAIDPLSPKNKELSEKEVIKIIAKNDIPLDKPLLLQVSRFDKWKDPLGVIEMFKEIEKKIPCHLVLIGSMATDDPEGPEMYAKISRVAEEHPEISVISKRDDYLVNALQRKATVVVQNSKKEGFGLVATEAMWKKTPVVARDVGGLALQIDHRKNGFLYENSKEAQQYILKLLAEKKMRKKMGNRSHKKVKENFLITSYIESYLKLLREIFN